MTSTTQLSPLKSLEPLLIARQLIREEFSTPLGYPGLWFYRDIYHLWYGGRWSIRTADEITDQVKLAMENAYIWEERTDGPPLMTRYAPDPRKVDAIVWALRTVCRYPNQTTPAFLHIEFPLNNGGEEGRVVTFLDRIAEVGGGELVLADMDERWFEPNMLNVPYVEGAKCPLWLRCLDEWGGGDPLWGKLLQRWFGYCMMPHRTYAKWLLMYGKARSGKGTIAKVLKALMGSPTYLNTSLATLSRQFGMTGVEHTRVLSINEVNKLDSREGEHCVQVLKSILGQDPLDVEYKRQTISRNLQVDTAIMMQANEIPRLPNKGEGLSSKMLVLPFDISFLGREDDRLVYKLEQELPGIAQWGLEGAREIEGEKDPKVRWPRPGRAGAAIDSYHLMNNPLDSFLEARCVPDPEGFVATQFLWGSWKAWLEQNEISIRIPRNQLAVQLEADSTWDIKRCRAYKGPRGLKGLRLLKTPDDIL